MFFLSDLEIFYIYRSCVSATFTAFKQSGLGKIEKLFRRAIKLLKLRFPFFSSFPAGNFAKLPTDSLFVGVGNISANTSGSLCHLVR